MQDPDEKSPEETRQKWIGVSISVFFLVASQPIASTVAKANGAKSILDYCPYQASFLVYAVVPAFLVLSWPLLERLSPSPRRHQIESRIESPPTSRAAAMSGGSCTRPGDGSTNGFRSPALIAAAAAKLRIVLRLLRG